jgi:hypothetical protein
MTYVEGSVCSADLNPHVEAADLEQPVSAWELIKLAESEIITPILTVY